MEAAAQGGEVAQEWEAKKERDTGHNPEECPVCITVFDDTEQRPRTLPCGHTVCTLCINNLKQQCHVVCPECRISHAVPEGGHFPVCYIAEALIRRKKDSEAAAAAAPPPPSVGTGKGAAAAADQKEAAGLSGKLRSFLQEQEASVVAAITACQEVQAQLDQYQTTLSGWGEQQQQLEDRLQGVLDQSRSARELVRQEESRVAAKKKEAREGEQQLQAALEALRTPATDKEAGMAVVEVFRCTDEAEQVLKECRGSFPDPITATTVKKVKEASYAVLEAFKAAPDVEAHSAVAEEEPRAQPKAKCTIYTPTLKVEDLRNLTQYNKSKLLAGSVFGVYPVEGQQRHARISLEDGQMYLYTLKEGPLPPSAATVEMSQLVPLSPPYTVFLDLSWPGTASRRVHIRVSPDTQRARLMMLLCTGQRGPSYVGTRLYRVWNKGCHGECVYGGDYEGKDGEGMATLLPNLNNGAYRNLAKAGDVCSVTQNGPGRYGVGAQFAIITRDKLGNFPYDGVFGEVVQGLDAVVTAAEHTPITEVTVTNCGLVLWE